MQGGVAENEARAGERSFRLAGVLPRFQPQRIPRVRSTDDNRSTQRPTKMDRFFPPVEHLSTKIHKISTEIFPAGCVQVFMRTNAKDSSAAFTLRLFGLFTFC